MVYAAHDAVSLQISLAMVAFADHPDQWSLLRDRPDLAPQAVDEVMRWSPSVVNIHRTATEDIVYHGVRIPAGTFIMMCFVPAQRDPRVYDRPDSFDITAERRVPHLTFSAGPHYCLGAPAGRMELAEALVSLTSRLGAPEIVGPVTWKGPMGIRGPERLPLRFGNR